MLKYHPLTYLLSGLYVLLMLSLPGRTEAQNYEFSADWTSATLQGWEEELRISIMDRYHSRSGLNTDRGLFQYYLSARGIDQEYDLDLFTYKFTPQEDYLWYRNPNGVRTYVGSLNTLQFATATQFKTMVELVPNHVVMVKGKQQEDLRAQRIYAELAYRYEPFENHHIGIEHNAHSYKPDLDLNLFYQYGNAQKGMLRADVTFIDYLNNIVFDQLEVDPQFTDTLRLQMDRPMLYSFKAVSPQFLDRIRGEVILAFQPEHELEWASQRNSTARYKQFEKLNYQGLLLEYDTEYLSFGLTYKRTLTATRRDTIKNAPVEVKYESEQEHESIGAYILGSSQSMRWETWVWRIESSDTQQGSMFEPEASSFDTLSFDETRYMMRNRLQRRPQINGVIAGVEHLLDMRNYTEEEFNEFSRYAPSIHKLNSRITAFLGYQFHPRASIIVGAGYDLDGDFYYSTEGYRFDNAFGRIEIRW